jgi:putative transposase
LINLNYYIQKINKAPMDKDTRISRETLSWLFEQPLDTKISILQEHLSICQLIINQLLEQEVKAVSGDRYSHDKPDEGKISRWGFNPGSVNIGGKRVKVDVPRLRNNDTGEFKPLETYRELKDLDGADEQTMYGMLHGLSTRDYSKVMDHFEEGFGLSRSSVSSKFIRATTDKLAELEARDISQHRLVAVFIDGKHLAGQQMIIVMGITEEGDKVMLGLLQTSTENSKAIGALFSDLKERGMSYEQGLLFVTDGSKGIRRAIQQEFGEKAIIQRCIWHKRENILSYLPDNIHDQVKKEYHQALAYPNYQDARRAMEVLITKLQKLNRQAAASLKEGLEEILTLHKLELSVEFSASFSTTNCIESVNSQLRRHTSRVTNWSNSDQRYRWVAAALLLIEQKVRKVHNFRNLIELKESIWKYLLKTNSSEPSSISTNNWS